MKCIRLFLLFSILCPSAHAEGNFSSFIADNTATVRGSNLQARHAIDIAANDTNILASQDVNNSSNSSEHKNVNLSLGIYGGAAAKDGVRSIIVLT